MDVLTSTGYNYYRARKLALSKESLCVVLILSGLLTVFFVALLFTTARADDTISVKFSFPTNEA
ncbi:MAG: hypothetical protein U5N86_05020 [Planctomycetota bacterium]|nr:hypothetical protein [Planctomycetota bacterium]